MHTGELAQNPSMNTCDTCKWWCKSLEETDKPPMQCDNDKLHLDLRGNDTCGCDGYTEHRSGAMITGPQFGCVHHEPKP